MEAEKEKKETKASEEPYEEDDDYDDYMDCDPVEEEMYCDDFIENNYSYRYTLNDKEYDEYRHYGCAVQMMKNILIVIIQTTNKNIN